MAGDGPFLWLSETGPPSGFRHLPPGGMCLSAFLFVRRGERILLGKYREHPAWETLAGLDQERVRVHGKGWTIPASQVKYGEEPRDAAKRIAEEILQMPGMRLSEPRVGTDLYEPKRSPGRMHYDVWFLVGAVPADDLTLDIPPWYAQLAWHDPRALSAAEWARGHEDVAARWAQGTSPRR